MPYITPRGSVNSPIWIILDAPFSSDVTKGFILSGGLGFVYEKMFRESGLDLNSCYVCSHRPDTDDTHGFVDLISPLNQYHPPLILAVGAAAGVFLPELREKNKGIESSPGQLQKYAGSLLESKELNYAHYMMPLYGPDRAVQDWTERNVTTYIDLQKIKDELEYWRRNGKLRPLPERRLVYGDMSLDEVCNSLQRFRSSSILSIDIETVYPREKSAYSPHPGYPITVGIADSIDYGISFNLFRDIPSENRILWREMDSLLRDRRILGQNFFNFDALFFEALGFNISLGKVQDTLLRHHILWPELSHKLSFMNRQYTREPFYKDDGKHWSIKQMNSLRRYNCLDVCITMEIYERQEEEFQQRKHLI